MALQRAGSNYHLTFRRSSLRALNPADLEAFGVIREDGGREAEAGDGRPLDFEERGEHGDGCREPSSETLNSKTAT